MSRLKQIGSCIDIKTIFPVYIYSSVTPAPTQKQSFSYFTGKIMYWSHGKKLFVTLKCYFLQRTMDFSASRDIWFCKSKIKSEIESATLESAVILQDVCTSVCLNNLFAGRLFKGQCGAVFQQGICMKTKTQLERKREYSHE